MTVQFLHYHPRSAPLHRMWEDTEQLEHSWTPCSEGARHGHQTGNGRLNIVYTKTCGLPSSRRRGPPNHVLQHTASQPTLPLTLTERGPPHATSDHLSTGVPKPPYKLGGGGGKIRCQWKKCLWGPKVKRKLQFPIAYLHMWRKKITLLA
jgi:hypothetical protein